MPIRRASGLQSCGCVASMGLAAVAAHKLGGVIPVGALFRASLKIGQRWGKQPRETQIEEEFAYIAVGRTYDGTVNRFEKPIGN